MLKACRRWPEWVGRAAQLWAVVYGALAVHWTGGGRTGFPVANLQGQPPGGATGGTAIALLLVTGCVAAVISARSTSKGAVLGLVFATITAGVGTFGLALSAVGIVASGTVEHPVALVTQLAALVGAVLLFATTRAQSRRRRERCPRCGGHHPLPLRPTSALVRPVRRASSARNRRTSYLLLLGLLPWATVKTVWILGGSALGVTSGEWRATMDESDQSGLTRLLETAGIDITVLAALAGAGLVVALHHTYRLPRWLLLLPAITGAASLTLYGVPLVIWGSLTLAGVAPADGDPGPFTASGLAWMVVFGGLAFGGLGAALAISARSYLRRTQPICAPTGWRDSGLGLRLR
ncbi:hypothetical protein ACIBL3_32550 [Kribbella sp. NPDC050124]|uniref:hypothetical protein n=1 Tax=Kribbella sp. NPDC050124 TaxID=3364114 RepID=UPI0037B8F251